MVMMVILSRSLANFLDRKLCFKSSTWTSRLLSLTDFRRVRLDCGPMICPVDHQPFDSTFSGFFVSFDVAPQLDAPFDQCPPLQAYVTALQKQRLRSSIPYIVTYIMRPVVFTSSWGLEGLGLIVVQVGGSASPFSLCQR